ncbi:MAG: acetate--CoA ligase family protein [Dehalococcoidales bacterium]
MPSTVHYVIIFEPNVHLESELMLPMDIIGEALSKGQQALNEYDAKRFLSGFGIPVCREIIAGDVDSAVKEASKTGFPVVLKASGKDLFHKTEIDGIALNLKNEAEVKREAERLLRIPGSEAVLVQEMVKGERELVCGLIRDAHFGPCVMFGLGGIMTEVFKDIVFRVAPLTIQDSLEMVQEIQHKKLLEPFRGEAAADLEALAGILVKLGEIGRQHGNIQSIDINPLKIRPDGKPIAVDALVTLGEEPAKPSDRIAPKKDLTKLYEPESIAVIGASGTPGKAGHTVINNILVNGYKGKVYPVNPKGGEIMGLPVCSSIADLPDGVDLAAIVIPARPTVQSVKECIAKGVKAFVLCAGGFSEVNEGGEALQEELTSAIAEAGAIAVGPNTSGHTSTPSHFTTSIFPLGKVPQGNVSYIAQTGNFATHTMHCIIIDENFGVARVTGLGNKIDVDESDVLEYYAEDPETKYIFLYLESIKRPNRFIEVAREVTRRKPVFLLMGGITGEGAKAAVTHTASMASDERILDGTIRQAGITRLYEYSHLVLTARALAGMPLPKGNRVSFLAPSGAMLVVLSDLCHQRWGLDIPELEEKTRARLQEISPDYVRMRNPVDIWPSVFDHSVLFSYEEAIEALMKDKNIDAVVPVLMLAKNIGIPPLDFLVRLAHEYPEKPLYVTFSAEKEDMEAAKAFLEPRGVPTFAMIEEPFEVLSILNRCRQAMQRPG